MLGSVTEKLIRELPSVVVTKSKSILNLKIDSDISEMEKHMSNASRLEASGHYMEAIHQLKLSIQNNDLHIPALKSLARLYEKTGETEMAQNYRQKIEIPRKLWNDKVEVEIRKQWKSFNAHRPDHIPLNCCIDGQDARKTSFPEGLPFCRGASGCF